MTDPKAREKTQVVVTGASSGIGEAAAYEFARRGYRLVLVARREDRLKKVEERCRQLGSKEVQILKLDLYSSDAAKTLVDFAPSADIVVNNAGIGTLSQTLDTPISNHQNTVVLNAIRPMEITYAFAQKMRARKSGVIVNVASMAAFQALPFMTSYSAAKSFIQNFSEGLDQEIRRDGIRVVAFCPGGTWTEFFENAGYEKSGLNGLKRFMQSADEVAKSLVDFSEAPTPIAIPGFLNNVLYWLQKWVPRSWSTRSGYRVYSKLARPEAT
ncbi:MAG: SDR family NAD(P)-dependent oxidoreductase [Bdellovibrionales bacterium]|nr:SDR family NAD(P)-dependent oxidoreductase [Bdellovibrionales bacterium]